LNKAELIKELSIDKTGFNLFNHATLSEHKKPLLSSCSASKQRVMANFLNQGRATASTNANNYNTKTIVRRKRRKASTSQSSLLGFMRRAPPVGLFQQNRILLHNYSVASSQNKELQIAI
jgi:hypothetical protein